jgi:hypothetical protein
VRAAAVGLALDRFAEDLDRSRAPQTKFQRGSAARNGSVWAVRWGVASGLLSGAVISAVQRL